jgi:hypothetical protein
VGDLKHSLNGKSRTVAKWQVNTEFSGDLRSRLREKGIDPRLADRFARESSPGFSEDDIVPAEEAAQAKPKKKRAPKRQATATSLVGVPQAKERKVKTPAAANKQAAEQEKDTFKKDPDQSVPKGAAVQSKKEPGAELPDRTRVKREPGVEHQRARQHNNPQNSPGDSTPATTPAAGVAVARDGRGVALSGALAEAAYANREFARGRMRVELAGLGPGDAEARRAVKDKWSRWLAETMRGTAG